VVRFCLLLSASTRSPASGNRRGAVPVLGELEPVEVEQGSDPLVRNPEPLGEKACEELHASELFGPLAAEDLPDRLVTRGPPRSENDTARKEGRALAAHGVR